MIDVLDQKKKYIHDNVKRKMDYDKYNFKFIFLKINIIFLREFVMLLQLVSRQRKLHRHQFFE